MGSLQNFFSHFNLEGLISLVMSVAAALLCMAVRGQPFPAVRGRLGSFFVCSHCEAMKSVMIFRMASRASISSCLS